MGTSAWYAPGASAAQMVEAIVKDQKRVFPVCCKLEDEVLDKAVNQNGVELVKDVDIAAFQAAVQPIYENLKTSNPTTYAVVEEIRAMA